MPRNRQPLGAGDNRRDAFPQSGNRVRRLAVAAFLIGISTGVPAGAQPLLPAPPTVQCECACPTDRQYTAHRPYVETAADGDLVVEVHEDLLNRIVSRTDQRQSPVRDFVLGADVQGVESTTTAIQIDLQPSDEGVGLQLVLRGTSRSQTVGYTPQAAVRTLGVHEFTARKLVIHDGRLFRTERPRVAVSPSNQTLGVDTPVSGVPFLGDVASSIGFQAAESQRTQGEMIAAQKIRDGVGTEFNRRIDDELARLNRGWLDLLAPQLKRQNLDGVVITARSTDDWARYAVELPGELVLRVPQRATASRTPKDREGEAPAEPIQQRNPAFKAAPQERRPPRTPNQNIETASNRSHSIQQVSHRATASNIDSPVVGRIAIRDEFVDGLLSRLGLAGTTFRAADFSEPAAAALQVVDSLRKYGLEIAEIPPAAAAALQSLTIRFDEREPLRVAFVGDIIWIRARAALAVAPLIDLPVLQITLRYRIETPGDGSIRLAPVGLKLEPANAGDPALGSLALLLESQATAVLPAIRLSRDLRLPMPDAQPLQLTIESLQSDGGRLSLTVR